MELEFPGQHLVTTLKEDLLRDMEDNQYSAVKRSTRSDAYLHQLARARIWTNPKH